LSRRNISKRLKTLHVEMGLRTFPYTASFSAKLVILGPTTEAVSKGGSMVRESSQTAKMPNYPDLPTLPEQVEVHPAWRRLNDQLEWYDDKSRHNQFWYKIIKRAQLIFASSITVISFLDYAWIKFAMAALGACVAVLEGFEQLGQHNNLWASYRSTAESLKHEKYLFLASSGPYRNLKTDDALKRLAERVEEQVSTEHAQWVSETKQREQSEQG